MLQALYNFFSSFCAMNNKGKTGIKVKEPLMHSCTDQEGQRLWSSASVACVSCPGNPGSALWRFAGVNVHHFQAVLAAHSTTPVEFALALRHPADAGGVVAPPAAHHFTAVHATGGLVAHPTSCPKGPCKGNAAKVRRWILMKDSEHRK